MHKWGFSMRSGVISVLGALLLFTCNSFASDAIRHSVPDASEVGRGVFSYAFWDVYEATLYAPQGEWNPAQPFALSIEYFRDIRGKDIAERSVIEMRQQGVADETILATWGEQMRDIFPDVTKGVVLSAVYIPQQHTIFYHGNDVAGIIHGDDFGKSFFDIWLGEKTSQPKLRQALLGQ